MESVETDSDVGKPVNCSNTMDEKEVESRYYFHEVIPIEYDLPETLFEPSGGFESPSKGIPLGLPISMINPFAAALVPKRTWPSRKNRLAIGGDSVVLPGYDTHSATEDTVIRISPESLVELAKDRTITSPLNTTLGLTIEQIECLQNRGVVRLSPKANEPAALIIVSSGLAQERGATKKRGVQGLPLALGHLDDSRSVAGMMQAVLSTNSAYGAAVPNALYENLLTSLLADKRAGSFHMATLKGRAMDEITSMGMEEFTRLLAALQKDRRFGHIIRKLKHLHRPASPKPLPQYRIGVLIHYVQTWLLEGYSQGKLLKDISLYPNEKRKLEVLTWEKRKVERSRSFTSEFGAEVTRSTKLTDSSEIVSSLADSLSTHASGSVGGSIPIQAGASAKADAQAGVEHQLDSEIQVTLEHINEAAVEASQSYKMKHEVKIVESEESGHENKSVREIANLNQGQVLTFKHYEVSANYAVTTQRTKKNTLCLLVKCPDLGPFDLDFVMAFEDRLLGALLSDRYLPGFKSTKILAAQRWYDKRSELRPVEEEANRRNSTHLPVSNSVPTEGIPNKGVFATARKIRDILEDFIDIEDNAVSILDTFAAPIVAPFDSSIDMPSELDVTEAEQNLRKLAYWTKLKTAYPGFELKAREYVDAVTDALFDDNTNRDSIIFELDKLTDSFGEDWAYHVKMVALSAVLAAVAVFAVSPIVFVFWGTLLVPALTPLFMIDSNNGLPQAMNEATSQLVKYKQVQESKVITEQPVALGFRTAEDEPVADLLPKTLAEVPRLYDDKALAEAHADFEKLILHLEANKSYYTNEIWRQENKAQSTRRLSDLGIASFVSSKLVGFSGDYMAFGLRLEALPRTVRDAIVDNIPYDSTKDASVTESISLPTSGVRVKSILEPCNTLEKHLLDQREITNEMRRAELKRLQALAQSEDSEQR